MSLLDDVSILYEDADMLVVNKPAGLAVHADGRTKEKTLVDWIIANRPEVKGVGEPITTATGEVIERPGIVHRIDRETSGALIVAKNAKAFEYLKSQFKEHHIRKEYTVFVYGSLPKDFETIDKPIGRSSRDFRQRSVNKGARGEMREAQTYYEVLKRGNGATLVKAIPKTGRTHQIRIHFKSIGHPVVADPLYAPGKPKLLGFDRLALHARSLEFKTPGGKLLVIEAPYPRDFDEAIKGF